MVSYCSKECQSKDWKEVRTGVDETLSLPQFMPTPSTRATAKWLKLREQTSFLVSYETDERIIGERYFAWQPFKAQQLLNRNYDEATLSCKPKVTFGPSCFDHCDTHCDAVHRINKSSEIARKGQEKTEAATALVQKDLETFCALRKRLEDAVENWDGNTRKPLFTSPASTASVAV